MITDDRINELVQTIEKNKELEKKAITERKASESILLTALIDCKEFNCLKINYSALQWKLKRVIAMR